MEKIEIRFAEVMHLAEQIEAVAVRLNRLAEDTLLQSLNVARTVWQSDSADLLFKKEVKVNEQLREEAECIRKISQELAESAKSMYLAESTNNLLARTRIYL